MKQSSFLTNKLDRLSQKTFQFLLHHQKLFCHKYQAREDVSDCDEHASLLHLIINLDIKFFYIAMIDWLWKFAFWNSLYLNQVFSL
jgi:hypothetical protein